MAGLIPEGTAQSLPKRGLTLLTCEKWGYTVSTFKDQPCQIANYRDDHGQVVAQKVRLPGKDFTFLGEPKRAGLYGKHLWREKGRKVVITEGEIDALSVSQLQDHKWPVVSVPNGAQGAAKAIQKDLEWLEGFGEVVFLFDNDEPGIAAARECALILSPGKAKIARLPLKDANDMLVAGRGGEVIQAIWDAKTYRPDGIVSGADLWDAINSEEDANALPYPWAGLSALCAGGLRPSELVTFTAGTGIGKSQVCREIAHALLQRAEAVGYIALEESTRRTALGLMGIHLSKPLHLSREGISPDALRAAFEATVGSGRCYLYDHFGSIDSANLVSRVRYLVRGCGCRWIILDHLSIVVSGLGDGDERRLIDNAMTALRSLVQETGCGLILVCHLRRSGDERTHEEGDAVKISDLRGSQSIAQLSDVIVALERNTQSSTSRHISRVRLLKHRMTGNSGIACRLSYDPDTGRLTELPQDSKAEPAEMSPF